MTVLCWLEAEEGRGEQTKEECGGMGISENKGKLVKSQFYSEPWPVASLGWGWGWRRGQMGLHYERPPSQDLKHGLHFQTQWKPQKG